MAEQTSAEAWKIIMLAGAGDIVLGAGFALAGLMGWIGPDGDIYAAVGGFMALSGIGIVLWARHKKSEADNRRGDLN